MEGVDFSGVVGCGGLYFALLEGGVETSGVVEEWVTGADGGEEWREWSCGWSVAFEKDEGVGEVNAVGEVWC